MEGILERFDSTTAGIFSSGTWTQYFFVLHEQVLLITDLNERTKVLGKMHMAVSKILPEVDSQGENEIRLHSGLIEVHLKAQSIKEKINWKNALTLA